MRDTNSDGTADESLYPTTDANYNVTAVVDSTGVAVERFTCDPYGQLTICNATWTPRAGNTSTYDWTVTYTGHKLDTESGLYYGNRRYYSPTHGRWLSRDPLGYIDGMNFYEFCRVGMLCCPP